MRHFFLFEFIFLLLFTGSTWYTFYRQYHQALKDAELHSTLEPVEELVDLSKERIQDKNRTEFINANSTHLGVFHFLQITDLHISRFGKQGGHYHFLHFLKSILPIFHPEFVIVTGDITDAKDSNQLTSRQYLEEWDAYYQALRDANVYDRPHFWWDLRGNHDCFNVLNWFSDSHYFKNMSRVKKSGFSFHFQSHQHHYLFIGLDGCPNRGLARPFNFFGIYDQFDLDFLSRQVHLQTSLPLQHIFTFGHYPIGTTVNTRSSQGETLTSLMTDVSTYMCGHLHRFKVWDVPHMYYTHSSGLLELELADLKTHGAYRLNLVDQGHFVFRDLDLPKLPPIYLPWTLNYSYATLNPIQPPPVLLISSPIDVRFYLFHREPPLSSHWPLDQSIRVFLFTQLLPPFQWNNSIECFPSKNNTFSSSLPFPLFSSSSSSSSFFISLPEPTSHPPSLYITQWPDIMATLVNTSNCPCFRLHIKVLHVETQLQDFQQVYVDLQWRNLGLSSTLTSPTSNPWNLGTLILAMDFNKVFKIFFFLEYGLVFLVLFIPKLMLAINEWRWKWNASPSNSNQNFPHTSHHLKSKFTLLNPPSLPQSRDGEASVTERLSFSPFHHHFLLSFHRRDANIGWFDSLWLRFVVVTTIHRKEWYLMYFLALISLVVPYFKGELIEGHIGGFYLMGAHFGSRYLPLLDTWFFICNVWGTLYVPFIFWFSGWHLNALKTSSPSLNSSRGEGKVTLSQWIHWWWIAFSLMGHLYQLNSMVQNYGENLWWSYLTFTYFMIGIALAQSGLKLCYWSWLRFYKCFISTSVNKDQAKLKSN